MSQDSDVDRVAAALKGPVIRYHTFGNGPTRAPSRAAGTAQPISADAPSVPSANALPLALPGSEPPPVAPPVDTVVASGHAPADAARVAPLPPAAAPRPTAGSLLATLRQDARREASPQEAAAPPQQDIVEAAPDVPPRSLLEQLRLDSARQAPPADGLLALLTAPALWDVPRAAPPVPVSPPLVGQPIRAWAPAVAQGHTAPKAADGVPVGLSPAAPELAPEPAPASLAAMFRLVAAPPAAAAAPPTRTASLQDVLRGLRSARHG